MEGTADPGFIYCQGLACAFDNSWVEHAWVVDRDGLVIDPTWPWRGPDVEYVGVCFDGKSLAQEQLRNRVFGISNETLAARLAMVAAK
jgi:hypothetical protein